MIKVTGSVMKSEIANAIQKYNGAVIYSYYNTLLPFENCYHVNNDECSVKEFCDFVVDNVREKVNENDGLPLNMIVIYTNVSDVIDVEILTAYISRLEKVERLVGTVVVMTQWNDVIQMDEFRNKVEQLIEDFENKTTNRNMNDLEKGRYKALCEVLDLIDEQKK